MYDGKCTVYFRDKTTKELDVGCDSYNSQYGIPLSEDGSKLFVGSWAKDFGGNKKGLHAYDINSGALLWRVNEGKIRHIFVYTNYLIALKAYACIFKIDIDSGAILGQIKSGTIENIFNLGFPYVLADTMSGKLSVIDVEKMLIVRKYSTKTVNPFECLSCVIREAVLNDNKLTIYGFEEYPNKNYDISGSNEFCRIIDTDFPSKY